MKGPSVPVNMRARQSPPPEQDDRVRAEGMAVDVGVTDPCLRDTDGDLIEGVCCQYGGPCGEPATP